MKIEERMGQVESKAGWESLMAWLPSEWEKKMTELGAFTRARKISSMADYLRILFAYPVLHKSLPDLAIWAGMQGLADISHVSLWERFQKSTKFLRWLLQELLQTQAPPPPSGSGLVFTPVDGTSFSLPGSKGRDWLVTVRWSHGWPLDILINKIGGKGTGESLCRLPEPRDNPDCKEVILADRAYGTPPQLADALDKKRSFIVRFTWNNLPLYDAAKGERIDPMRKLAALKPGEIGEFTAWSRPKGHDPIKLRIVVVRKTIEAENLSRQRSRKESERKGHCPRKETLFLAGFVTLATNLETEELDAVGVCLAYRWRWQIEREFKRLKTTSNIRRLDNFKDESVEPFLLTLFIVWFLANRIARESAFSPWGCPLYQAGE